VPVQLLPASVVLGVVVDRIRFKALQFFSCVQWGFLPLADQTLKQLKKSFHSPILLGHGLACPGHDVDHAFTDDSL